jgi:mRNA interferase RelE/StbE
MTVDVLLGPEAQIAYDELPATIQARVNEVVKRLTNWPNVSGAKPLRGELVGHYRIRTGDWRVVFRPVTPRLLIVRIAHRRDVYED